MAKFTYTQYSFSSGELNPRLLGRTDTKEYFNSAKEVTNFSLSSDSGLNQCRGTYWLKRENTTQTYDFTFSEKYVFGISGASILFAEVSVDGPTGAYSLVDVALSKTLPDNVTSFVYGTHVSINDIVVITDKSGNVEPLVLALIGGVWSLVTLSAYATLVGGLGFTVAQREYRAAPFPVSYSVNVLETLTLAGTTLTASGFSPFTVGHIGSHIILNTGTTDFVVKVTAFTSSTIVSVADVEGAAPDQAYDIYKLPEWFDGNQPRIVSFFQQRLIFANTDRRYDIAWLSAIGNLVDFFGYLEQDKPTETDDSAPFQLQPSTTDSTPIKWIVPERYISMGTGTEEYIVQGAEAQLSNRTASITSVSHYGSAGIGLAFRAQSATYFVERDGTTIREMSFSEENGGYSTRNIGLLGPELDTISKLVYDYPRKRLYVKDGSNIRVCTIDQSASVLGWANLVTTAPESSSFSGVLDIQGELLLAVKTSFNTEALQFYTESDLAPHDDEYPVGASLMEVVEVSGSDYRLANNNYVFPPVTDLHTVKVYNYTDKVWVDSLVKVASGHPDFTDGDLYITSAFIVKVVCKSLWPDAIVETAPIQQGSPIGDAQIAFQRVDKVGLRLYKTKQGLEVGTTETSLETVELEGEYTGLKEVCVDGSPELDHTIIMKNSSALPCVILSVSGRGNGEIG